MDRNLAERIVKGVMDLSPPFNVLDELSLQIADADTAREFRLALGELMGGTVGLLRPIIRSFPDLDPAGTPTHDLAHLPFNAGSRTSRSRRGYAAPTPSPRPSEARAGVHSSTARATAEWVPNHAATRLSGMTGEWWANS